jgi:hypothetical protein
MAAKVRSSGSGALTGLGFKSSCGLVASADAFPPNAFIGARKALTTNNSIQQQTVLKANPLSF